MQVQASENHCHHCHEKIIISHDLNFQGNHYQFCCQGCLTVFEILQENDLSEYYAIREQSEESKFQKVASTQQKYSYLDSDDFKQENIIQKDEYYQIEFYLENIHCIACLWLLERLPVLEEKIISIDLNMSESIIKILFVDGIRPSQIAKKLEVLGYPPHVITEDKQRKEWQKKEDQKDLIRIAISFFCAGNIMLLAYSNYAGAEGIIKTYFNDISTMLFLPVITYAAWPFYKSAFAALRMRVVNIDLPIVIALILGAIYSFYEYLTKGEHIYYDTFATLIFLILLIRFLLQKSQKASLNTSSVSTFFTNILAYKYENHELTETVSSKLQINDLIQIKAGETIPADAIIKEGSSLLNCSLLTGESELIKVNEGEIIHSGTINIQNDLQAKVIKTSHQSKLGQILAEVAQTQGQNSLLHLLSQKIARYFLTVILLLSIGVFGYFYFTAGIEVALNRFLALIIITCPCALALTTPLIMTLTINQLLKQGVIVKNALSLEKIFGLRKIYFDKTGTLTKGRFEVNKFFIHDEDKINLDLLFELEKRSKHPIAHAICDYIKHHYQVNSIELENFQVLPGQGPSASFKGQSYHVSPIKVDSSHMSNTVGLYRDDEVLIEISLADEVKPEAKDCIADLQSKGFQVSILSGDQKSIVESVAQTLSINTAMALSELTPQDKRDIIDHHPDSIMLGDGANDAIALKKASVGIAVRGSVDLSMRACSIFFSRNSLENLTHLINAAFHTKKLIYLNITFSILYNIFGIYFALSGKVTPLFAAVLMPISSLTTFLLAYLGTRKIGKK